MKINCNIVDDLLPLYIDGGCSEESKALLEEHLRECPSCQEKLRRMQSDNLGAPAQAAETSLLVNYAKKVKRHRLRAGILITIGAAVAALLLSLMVLTIIDMRRQASQTVYPVEAGVYNLTAEELETTPSEVDQYVLFTNSTNIKVNIQSKNVQTGFVSLWDASDDRGYIQINEIDGTTAECTFRGLSASRRYRVVCDGLSDVTLTISEERTVSFWHSLKTVSCEIFDLL